MWPGCVSEKRPKIIFSPLRFQVVSRLIRAGMILPDSIRDALCLVEKLGERFLWVDCLCIIQDDCASKRLNLNSCIWKVYRNLFNLSVHDLVWPDWDSWQTSITNFNARKLTYDEDVLDAFAGIQSLYARGFSGRMLWGIPEMFFDHGILWVPMNVLRRRTKLDPITGRNTLPRWSWAGWEGKTVVLGVHYPPIDRPEREPEIIEIQPLLEAAVAFCAEKSAAPVKPPTQNIWDDLQRKYKNNLNVLVLFQIAGNERLFRRHSRIMFDTRSRLTLSGAFAKFGTFTLLL